MHPSPHPNQVRSACERCRRQKLRCSRQAETPPDQPCARCTRVGIACQTGAQRKVGRPAKKDTMVRRGSPLPFFEETSGAEPSFGDMARTIQLDDRDPLGCPAAVDWMVTPGSSPFAVDTLDGLLVQPHDLSLLPELDPPKADEALVRASSNAHFASLSKVNVDLHRAWENLGRQASMSMSMDVLMHGICKEFTDELPRGTHALQVVLEATQAYVGTIKALHRELGLGPKPTSQPAPHGDEFALTTSPRASDLTLDSPTAFLVISCFSQIIKFLELIFTVVNAHMGNPNPSAPCVYPGDFSFSGVKILDFPAQVVMYAELLRHLFRQILLLLGLPGTSWPGKTAWTGLLAPGRYRDMANEELGSVEGMWSTRPARVMEMINAVRDLVLLNSMPGYT